MTGSKEAIGLFRDLLDVTCSCKTVRAACDCSTPMSSWARCWGGFGLAGLWYKGGKQWSKGAYFEYILRLGMRRRRHLGQRTTRMRVSGSDSPLVMITLRVRICRQADAQSSVKSVSLAESANRIGGYQEKSTCNFLVSLVRERASLRDQTKPNLRLNGFPLDFLLYHSSLGHHRLISFRSFRTVLSPIRLADPLLSLP